MRPLKPQPVYGSVPSAFPGETIVCIASGPSLTRADVAFCRDRARVLVINDGYRLAPWADVLYAADENWWKAHPAAQQFAGMKFGIGPRVPDGVTALKISGPTGLSSDPRELRKGKHSGYQGIGVAAHLGASLIVLLGYDLQNTYRKAHWFGNHPAGLRTTNPALFIEWRQQYATLLGPLAKRGIRIVNCSRETSLTTIPRAALADVLPNRLEAAS